MIEENLGDSSFFGENLCILQWDKSNRAMTNAGELKFWQLQSGKKGEKGSFFDLSKSYLAPNVGGVEESGNNFAFIIIFYFIFIFQHFRCIKKRSSLFICYIFVRLSTS